MDPIANPYAPGAGLRPPRLSGREEHEEAFRILIGRLQRGRPERSIMVSGLRGIGKTVLLNDFRRIAAAADWIAPDVVEVRPDVDFRATVARLGREALHRLSVSSRSSDRLRRLASVLRAFTLRLPSGYGGVEIAIDVDPLLGSADSGDLEQDLVALLVELAEAARDHETGVALLIDEMQHLAGPELEAVCAAMHRIGQLELPLALAGAGLPQLPALLANAKTYAERLFQHARLDRLDDAASRAALVDPALAEGVAFDDWALDVIVGYTEGYPYFLQQYGKTVWDIATTSPITVEDAVAAQALVQDRLDSEFFAVRLEKASPAERIYLAAMAGLGDGTVRSAAIAAALVKPPQSLSYTRDSLVKKGLVYAPATGTMAFTVPRFADYVRRVDVT